MSLDTTLPCRKLSLSENIPVIQKKKNYVFLTTVKMFVTSLIITIDSVALVRDRTIPTERPRLVGENNANFLRIEGSKWSE
jgi:hypothetical protein